MKLPNLTQPQIERIAQVFGDTSNGFTGSEIEHHLSQCRIPDPDPGMTKWKRLYNAFAAAVNSSGGSSSAVYAFIQHCFEPVQAIKNPERYNWMRSEINTVLMLIGAEIQDDGLFHIVSAAGTVSDIQKRKEPHKKDTGYEAGQKTLDFSKEKPTVFISYNWESDDIADQLQKKLMVSATVVRDKSSLKPWGDLRDFMKSIRQQDFVVLIISDKYLRSAACLYEVLQLMKDEEWDKKVMYLVTDDAHSLYDVSEQLNYIQYWDNKASELRGKLKNIDYAAAAEQARELQKYELIRLNIGDFMSRVKNRSNPNIQDGIDAVAAIISKRQTI